MDSSTMTDEVTSPSRPNNIVGGPSLTELTDFDYIGTGGFLIVCGSGNIDNPDEEAELLGVTSQQAEKLIANCPFIEKCLSASSTVDGDNEGEDTALQMKEAADRIIFKPDWSLAIARHFVEVLSKGRTAISTLELYEQLMLAGDQALVDLRLSSMVNYIDVCPQENEFLRLVNVDLYCFKFQAIVTGDQWLTLLQQGVLLFREETNYVVQLYDEEPLTAPLVMARRNLDTRRSEFRVHADRSIDAMMKIQKVLEKETELQPQPEAFSIYFETYDRIEKVHHQMIDRLAGGEAYIRTCADAGEYQTEGYTVKASLDVLARAVRPLAANSVVHCSVRIDHPTPDTLGRFVNACSKATSFQGTLGLNASINRWFCRKPMMDIHRVLEYMADFSTTAKINGDFKLFEFCREDESFG